MVTIRKANERGRTRIGWLDGWHTFSFGEYHDPEHMNFRALRVINDDTVAPGGGFATHPHRDMEIITIVLDGVLAHRDSLGSEGTIRPGEVQVMSAGSGIRHSEFNGSQEHPVHLLQVWVIPQARGLTPAYEQKRFEPSESAGRFRRVAGRDGGDGSLTINQDVDILVADLSRGQSAGHAIRDGRGAWVHVATGSATVNGIDLNAGDAAAVEAERGVEVRAGVDGTKVILFDCA